LSATRLCLLGDAASIHLQRWAQAMVERGFGVSVVSAAQHEIAGVQVVALPPVRRDIDWFLRLPALRRAVHTLAPDIVHAHYITSYGIWGAACGRRPLVLTAWGSDILVTPRGSPMLKALTRWTLRRAVLITADSRDVLDEIRGYRPRAELHEVFWGADTERFRPHAGPREPGFHIASLRAWEPNYRVDTLVRAFVQFVAARPSSEARLHLFGGGSQAARLQVLVDQLGVAGQVVWHGWLAPPVLAERLAACDVSVSVPQSDATSVSLLESMACGLPVIVSDLPANRQWVAAHGGYVVPVDDMAALADALCAVFDDEPARRRQGAFNRERVEQLGSTRSQMDRMAALYRALPRSAAAHLGEASG
jgi:glycosyltransferase involved in cell wall biosynthesis